MVGLASAEGIVLGAHRGFSHNSFKFNTFVSHSLVDKRDHGLYHKFVYTDAEDPYNAKRGFLFSHIGLMMMRKHHLVAEKGKAINTSDIESNKLIKD